MRLATTYFSSQTISISSSIFTHKLHTDLTSLLGKCGISMVVDPMWMFWHLVDTQCYGLTQFKRCVSTYTRSYTVADLSVAGCRQHYLSQTDSDKGLHWYFDIRAFCMGQPNRQLFHLGTRYRCEYDSAFGQHSRLRSESDIDTIMPSVSTYRVSKMVACFRVAYHRRLYL